MRVFGSNYSAGSCLTCGVRVPAQAGLAGLVDGTRVIWCGEHRPTTHSSAPAAPVTPTVQVTLDGGQLLLALVGRQPREVFDRYLAAKRSAGVRSTQTAGVWRDRCEVAQAGAVTQALEAAGLAVQVAPAAAEAIRAAAAAVAHAQEATQTRLAHPQAAGLFAFQRTGVEWLAGRTGALLSDEMGCGKSVQTLMALGEDRPVLLVVPASLKLNWAREAARWRPEYRVSVLEGRDAFRWPTPGEIVIVNYDILPAIPETWRGYGALPLLEGALAKPPARLVLVADEAHALKTPKAQRTLRFRLLGEIARRQGGQVWLLTGTPLLNRPIELWNVAASGGVAGEAFGSFDRFKALFNAVDGRYGIEWGEPEPEVPGLLRRVQLRREKKDVLADLPAKTRKIVSVAVEIGKRDRATLDKALSALEEKIKTAPTVSAADAAAVPAFPAFEQFSTALTRLAAIKTEAAIEYVEPFLDEGRPFLVFAAHLEPLHAMKAAIEKAGKTCGLIVGDVSAQDRQQVVEDFQAGKLDAVCLSIQAGGVGLTLTRATDSVFVDLSVVPALNVQAEDRIHRIGQRAATTIHQLRLDHPLDERIFDILARKTELFEAAVGASTLLPTEQAPTDERAQALVDAATRLVVAEVPADEEPATTVQTVTYSYGGRSRKVIVAAQARPARTAVERWAADAIQTLSDLDPDRAAEDNGVGWSAADGSQGHALAALIRSGHGLTDAQWEATGHLLGRYWRQVGRAPRARGGEALEEERL